MIRFVKETGSTNTDLVDRIKQGEYVAEGDWLVADRQNAGKGRLGRDWFDATGNFMGSTVVRVAPGQPAPASLAFVVALAVHEAVAHFVPLARRLELKWPNDLLLDGAKLAGILLEMAGEAVVIGIGVNLVAAPQVPDRRTASLLRDTGMLVDRDTFAHRLADCLDRELERWRGAGLAPLLRRWQSVAHPEGTPLRVHPPGEDPIEGAFAGLSDEGALRLRCGNGGVRLIHAGDVFLRDIAG